MSIEMRVEIVLLALLILSTTAEGTVAQANRDVPGRFLTSSLPEDPDYLAPDGSEVRLLVRGDGGSMAHFRLPRGRTSAAVAHHTVEEIWYVISGRGEMWRKLGDHEEVIHLEPGVSLTLPRGTHFQFRALGEQALEAVGTTMPPWPGSDEAYPVEGIWTPGESSESRRE